MESSGKCAHLRGVYAIVLGKFLCKCENISHENNNSVETFPNMASLFLDVLKDDVLDPKNRREKTFSFCSDPRYPNIMVYYHSE